jgi:hypothetical protein
MKAGRMKRVGRPRTRENDGPGEYVGFRASKDLKEKLEAAAHNSARSLSSEAQFRLEQSFRDESTREGFAEMFYGEVGAGLLKVFGEAIQIVTILANTQSKVSPGKDEWLSSPAAFDAVDSAIRQILDRLRPAGDFDPIVNPGTIAVPGVPPTTPVGIAIAEYLLRRIAADKRNTSDGLSRIGARLRAKLGDPAAARISKTRSSK